MHDHFTNPSRTHHVVREMSSLTFRVKTMSGEFPVELPADATVGALKARLLAESAEFVARRQRLVILDATSGEFVRIDHDDARTLHSLGLSSGATIDLLMECEPLHECPSLFPLSVTNGRFKTPDPRPHRQVLEISNPPSSASDSSSSPSVRVRAWRDGDPEPDVLSWSKDARGLQLPCLHERFPTLLFSLEAEGCGDWDLEVDSRPRTAERTRDAFEAEMKEEHASVFRRRNVEQEFASVPLGTVWTESPLRAGCSTGLFLTVESVEHARERLLYKREGIQRKAKGAAAASAVADEDSVKDIVLTYCVADPVEDDDMRSRCRRIDINLTTGELEPTFVLDNLAPNEWEIFDFLKSDLASSASIREKYPTRCLCGHNELQRLFTVQCEYCGVRQHGVCAGVTEQSMAQAEESYACEECQPQPDLYPGHGEGATFPAADAAAAAAGAAVSAESAAQSRQLTALLAESREHWHASLAAAAGDETQSAHSVFERLASISVAARVFGPHSPFSFPHAPVTLERLLVYRADGNTVVFTAETDVGFMCFRFYTS